MKTMSAASAKRAFTVAGMMDIVRVGGIVIQPAKRKFGREIVLSDVFKPGREIVEGSGVRIDFRTANFIRCFLSPHGRVTQVPRDIVGHARSLLCFRLKTQLRTSLVTKRFEKYRPVYVADFAELLAQPADVLSEFLVRDGSSFNLCHVRNYTGEIYPVEIFWLPNAGIVLDVNHHERVFGGNDRVVA